MGFFCTDNRNIRRIETISIAYIYDTRALLLLLLIFTQQNSCLLGCKNAQVVISKKKKIWILGKNFKGHIWAETGGKKMVDKMCSSSVHLYRKGRGAQKRKNLLIINGN